MTPQRLAIAALEGAIFEAYRERTPNSRSWHERACRSLVGGVSGSVRYFRPYPLHCVGGTGARTIDADGNSYIDHFLCGASLMLGHRAPEIMGALEEARKEGSILLNDPLSTELAELLQETIPCAERVRFLNSGTEAVMSALRIARAYTGKTKVIKFYGIYHGQTDEMLVGLDLTDRSLGSGIPATSRAQTVMARFGDFEQLHAILKGEDVAAILLDPAMHHSGLWAGTSDEYALIKDMAHAAGTLLVFDEVISGFRLASGGAQSYFRVVPDLAVFGKALGAGEKIGAVVGRADIMSVADPSRERPDIFAYQSGTGNDVRSSVAAAIAAVNAYRSLDRSGGYEQLAARARRLGAGLQQAFADQGIGCLYNALGPMVRIFLTDGPQTPGHCGTLNMASVRLFHTALLTEGVLTLPGSNDFFLSFAHGDGDVDEVVSAAGHVLGRFDFRLVTSIGEGGG